MSSDAAALPAQKGSETVLTPFLVTGAQYQVFLEAQRFRGRFCQLDHWSVGDVPEDQRGQPILGIRASDAQAFCQWLTEQEHAGWCYRLPGQEDQARFAKNEAALFAGLPQGSGYWMSTGSDTIWRRIHPLPVDSLRDWMQTFVRRDWSRPSADLADFAYPVWRVRPLTRFLACDPEQDLAQDLALALRRLQGCALEQSLARAQKWAGLFEQMQILALAHISDFHRALVGDLSGHATINERSRMFTRVRDLTSLLVNAGDLSGEILSMLRRALDRTASNLSEQREEEALRFENSKTLLLASLRSCVLLLAGFLRAWSRVFFAEDIAEWFQQFLWGKDYADLDRNALEQVVAGCLDLYLTLVILELRREAQLPAWEALLLVKTQAGSASPAPTSLDEHRKAVNWFAHLCKIGRKLDKNQP